MYHINSAVYSNLTPATASTIYMSGGQAPEGLAGRPGQGGGLNQVPDA